jgi:hypothetical protein
MMVVAIQHDLRVTLEERVPEIDLLFVAAVSAG